MPDPIPVRQSDLDLRVGVVEVRHVGRDQGGTKPLVTTIRVESNPRHARLHIWNRGGKAGELVVDVGDAREIVDALIPRRYRIQERIV